MLVVMGPVLEVPVTDLFAAAIVPGAMLALMYTGYALLRCWIDPSLGPVLPMEDRANDWGVVAREFFLGLVPPAALVAFALGSILFGWATPTEGAGCGAFGALALTLAYRKMTFGRLGEALIKTLEISVLILFLVAASNFFGAVFSRLGTPGMLTNYLLGLDMSPTMILIIIMAFIFLLGWPLEWVPIVLIIVPILIPVALGFGIDPVHFGIIVVLNLMISTLTPPMGMALFVVAQVGNIPYHRLAWAILPWLVPPIVVLVLVCAFPFLATALPGLMD
jgi:tripartite ATP-independent transporter DctM subunit